MTFSERIEHIARLITRERPDWKASPGCSLRRELALALEELDRTRSHHRTVEQQIIEEECELATEMMLPILTPDYRLELQKRMLALKKDRRQLAQRRHTELVEPTRKLLDLLNKHLYLDDEH